MGGVGRLGGRVEHLLGVAVVGGDDQLAAFGQHGVDDLADTGVDGLDRGDGGVELAGVADHVAVGEVHEDEVRAIIGGHGVEHDVADLERRHLRLEVIGRDFG